MKKIRLLQVIPNLNSGGAERGTVDIANAIVKSDNISFVVSNGGRLERNLKLNKTYHNFNSSMGLQTNKKRISKKG